ncbi:ATP-binding cassette sub-family B member 10, mitochondrial [Drosophila hydei]|uniref:ATP-binding cassette sub-family B member 10, mitochondrial n=1 Tax=Drosophila hydei TaxID=7224 RepID=A0A6J1LAX3_DROHY|nr:ATP-binding cassette sub-family B member 10, mitochondrial [Drosophila hydei]
MLLNCTRVKHMCTTLRITQIPCVVRRFPMNSSSIHNYMLRRQHHHHHHLYNIRPPAGRQLLSSPSSSLPTGSVGAGVRSSRWTARLLNVRRCMSSQDAKLPEPKMGSVIENAKFATSRLIRMMKEEKWVLLMGLACLVISSTITMSVPYFLGKVIDIVFNKNGMDESAVSSLQDYSKMLVGIFVIGGLANFSRVYLFGSAALRIVRRLRSRLYRSMLMQEVSWFDTRGTGELVNRLSNDTYFVGTSLSQNISDGFRSLAMIGVGAFMMVYTSAKLALISALIVPALAGIAIVYGRYVRRITKTEMDKFAEVMKHAEERFGNVRTVKVFGRENSECAEYDKQLDEAIQIGYKETKARSVFFGLTGFSGNVVIISVLYYGGTLVLNEELSIGAMTSFMLYAGYSAVAMNGLSNFYSQLNKGIGASQRIWEIMDREYAMPIDKGIMPTTEAIGEVEFRNISFAYPSRVDSKVLSDFSLKLNPNETTALVGRSGSGKSTTAMLLMRLYDPQQGAIYLDGVDLKTLNPHWLRQHVSAVSQEPVLFSGSIRSNILYGLQPDKVPDEQLFQKVVRDSNVNEFVSHLPDGLETIVGQRGILLSGGQKQRVAIARALIKNPTILILDEATSALDAVSEELVQTALEKLIRGRTVITIAHRLSTIHQAHKIAVIDDGRVVEEGTFGQLMNKSNGVFKELVSKQALGSKP